MNKLRKILQSYQTKWTAFALLLLLVPACLINRTRDDTKPENKPAKSETAERKDTGGIEKLKTQAKPKETEKTAFSSATDDLKRQVCRKYDECGSQDYEECMEEAADLFYEDEVWACMLNSSCESLREGKPDACVKSENSQVTTTAPDVPNCSGTTCTRNSDCPSGCHGGCSEGRCYLF